MTESIVELHGLRFTGDFPNVRAAAFGDVEHLEVGAGSVVFAFDPHAGPFSFLGNATLALLKHAGAEMTKRCELQNGDVIATWSVVTTTPVPVTFEYLGRGDSRVTWSAFSCRRAARGLKTQKREAIEAIGALVLVAAKRAFIRR